MSVVSSIILIWRRDFYEGEPKVKEPLATFKTEGSLTLSSKTQADPEGVDASDREAKSSWPQPNGA